MLSLFDIIKITKMISVNAKVSFIYSLSHDPFLILLKISVIY